MATKTTNPTTTTTPPPAYDSLTTNNNNNKNESSKLENTTTASSSVVTSNQNAADENASSCASLSIQELRKLAPNVDRLGYDANSHNDEGEEKIALTCHVVNPKKIGQGMNTQFD
jgi:hypothetical protein